MKAVVEIIRRQKRERLALRLLGAAIFGMCLLIRPLTRSIHSAYPTADETIVLRRLRSQEAVAARTTRHFESIPLEEVQGESLREESREEDETRVLVVFEDPVSAVESGAGTTEE